MRRYSLRTALREHPGDIATTEPVLELLAGASSPAAFGQLDRLTSGLQLLTVDNVNDYRDAALTYRAARTGGRTVPRLLDCLIAAVALRTGATIVHRDRDFDVLAETLPDLRVRSLV